MRQQELSMTFRQRHGPQIFHIFFSHASRGEVLYWSDNCIFVRIRESDSKRQQDSQGKWWLCDKFVAKPFSSTWLIICGAGFWFQSAFVQSPTFNGKLNVTLPIHWCEAQYSGHWIYLRSCGLVWSENSRLTKIWKDSWYIRHRSSGVQWDVILQESSNADEPVSACRQPRGLVECRTCSLQRLKQNSSTLQSDSKDCCSIVLMRGPSRPRYLCQYEYWLAYIYASLFCLTCMCCEDLVDVTTDYEFACWIAIRSNHNSFYCSGMVAFLSLWVAKSQGQLTTPLAPTCLFASLKKTKEERGKRKTKQKRLLVGPPNWTFCH